ncbi:MAG: VanZ family protein [Bacteroidales bacterium]|nr:VanZ family protein [Bacteroidales bacterium]
MNQMLKNTLPGIIIKFWKPILFGIFILVLCLVPSTSLQKIDFLKISFQDLLAHLSLFFIFSFLLTWDFKKYKSFNNNKSQQVLFLFLICLLFAASTEMLQYTFPSLNRSANVIDFMFDLTGALAGFFTAYFIR